jgi:Flp pilus assembly protein TadB
LRSACRHRREKRHRRRVPSSWLWLFKIGWTFVFSTGAGAMSHLPAALVGLVLCDALILYVMRRMRRGSSFERAQPGGDCG